VERRTGKTEETEIGSGTLFSSGLIAGGAITGVLFAMLVGAGLIAPLQRVGDLVPALHQNTLLGNVAAALLFAILAVILARVAQKKVV
jgi:hypothetical protein